ncbi:MAG: YbjQ family protein [Anaerovoracaceae bacterium]|jgi:uncharacterized protein YbjQ (UPF0145 family)
MDSKQKYQIAYKKHYNEGEIETAFILYKDIIETHTDSKEAGYSKAQIENIERSNPGVLQNIKLHKVEPSEIYNENNNTKDIMKNKILITTTNSINGKEIEEYLDIISDRLVVGAGLFSEVFASFTDVFGGRSAKFESRMTELNTQMMNSLKKKANELDADAIVGLSIDLDEISGKGFQMFMISGVGTAVKLKKDQTEKTLGIKGINENENFNIADKIDKIAKLKENGILTEEEFIYLKSQIINHKQ